MDHDWMSLGEVAEMLGVHTSTVRAWANEGHLPVHRTQGGHRRFHKQDIEIWMRTRGKVSAVEFSSAVQSALRRTRLEIGEGHLANEAWYQKLDAEARDQYRQSGRSLLFGLINYLAADGALTDAEPRSLGYEYASRGWRCGLSSTEATHALFFFRNLLVGSMLSFYENADVRSPQAWADMVRKLNSFTDQILLTLLDTYEAYQRGASR
ncbi:MAG: helix-turn-helix domain-containing protein [Anaerolineales bacterium]|jgi:excisionase family DNA binding protein|nr:helix-turn-helix domain-containing protein [Anaerolineales bacterium]